MRDDDVRLPLANHTRDELAVLQRRHQLAIVNVEHLGGHPELFGAGGGFGRAAHRQRSARLLPVAHIPVRDRNELHMMPQPRPLHRRACRFVFRIIRMRAEDDDA
jgi:hypothetical protein